LFFPFAVSIANIDLSFQHRKFVFRNQKYISMIHKRVSMIHLFYN
jgi:hypothetical protein